MAGPLMTGDAKAVLRAAGSEEIAARTDLFDRELGDVIERIDPFLFRSPKELSRLLCRVGLDSVVVLDDLIEVADRQAPEQRIALEASLLRALAPRAAMLTVPPESLFDDAACKLISSYAVSEVPAPLVDLRQTVGRPIDYRGYLCVILKVTRLCNLRCVYCHDWSNDPKSVIELELLIKLVAEMLGGPRAALDLILHGGEPLMMGQKRFLQLLYLLARFARPGQIVRIHIQSNATLLTARWIALLKLFDIHVSVSLDGPCEMHDAARPDALGRPSWHRAMKGIRELDAANLFSGVLIVVGNALLEYGARRLHAFLQEERLQSVCLLAERPTARDPTTVPQSAYVEFLIEFERARHAAPKPWVAVREIDAIANLLKREPSGFCELAGNCIGHFVTVEASGEVSHCDKYTGDPAYRLGDLRLQTIDEILQSPATKGVANTAAALAVSEDVCPYERLCQGWCPHERYVARNSGTLDHQCCGLAPLFRELERGHCEGRTEVNA